MTEFIIRFGFSKDPKVITCQINLLKYRFGVSLKLSNYFYKYNHLVEKEVAPDKWVENK